MSYTRAHERGDSAEMVALSTFQQAVTQWCKQFPNSAALGQRVQAVLRRAMEALVMRNARVCWRGDPDVIALTEKMDRRGFDDL